MTVAAGAVAAVTVVGSASVWAGLAVDANVDVVVEAASGVGATTGSVALSEAFAVGSFVCVSGVMSLAAAGGFAGSGARAVSATGMGRGAGAEVLSGAGDEGSGLGNAVLRDGGGNAVCSVT